MSAIMGWRDRLLWRADNEVRPVIEKHLAAGAVLFRAGEPCTGVALIRDGAVELLADDGGVPRRIGRRGKGAYVGDDAMFGAGTCRHTVVALRQTTVEMLARDVFLERHEGAAETAPVRRIGLAAYVVHLAPASAQSRAALPLQGIEIDTFPFVVGRVLVGAAEMLDQQHGLLLDDRPPYRLSRRQFVIVEAAGGVGLSDPGSRLGTYVDGVRLGIVPQDLPPGRTVEVCAGGPRSPFRFHLRAVPSGLEDIAAASD